MQVSRRDFLKLLGGTAAALGLSALELSQLEEALANPNAPSVIWLQGASCDGCTVSFLNRISTAAPTSVADVLINTINLVYHPTVMALAGQSAVQQAQKAYQSGNYVLIVEGGVATAFNGHADAAWTFNGVEVTFLEAVTTLAAKAKAVLCIGSCASYGGMTAAPPNPAAVKSVKGATGVNTINIPGCPPHPDWMIYAVAQLVAGAAMPLDRNGRPTAIYGRTVHSRCPRRESDEAKSFTNAEGRCLKELGCRGPETYANCPQAFYNGGVNWCIGANALCIGCTEPSFPGTRPFNKGEDGD